MRAPTELGGLQALRDEALDRPRVDEHAARLRVARPLGVALGDMDALDADALHQPAPLLAGLRLGDLEAEVLGEVEQGLLDHPGHHARVGPAAAHHRDPAGATAAYLEHALAQRVVRALRERGLGVAVKAGPGLADRVDIVAVDFLAERHQVGRRGVDRQVDDHAAARPAGEQRGQDLPVVLTGDRELLVAELALVEQLAVGIDGIDDHEFRAIEPDVTLQKRQGAAADGAEADHHDRAGELRVQQMIVVHAGQCIHIGYSQARGVRPRARIRCGQSAQ